jgi:hypothetical protein
MPREGHRTHFPVADVPGHQKKTASVARARGIRVPSNVLITNERLASQAPDIDRDRILEARCR